MSHANSSRITNRLLYHSEPRSKRLRTLIREYISVLHFRVANVGFCSWNEWVTFPIRYCDLPLSSQITFTVWDIAGPRASLPVGGSTFRLFGKKWYALLFF